jgi:tRNA threonylcarbamoyladenosine biosynthesis protein TsaB
MQTSGKTPWNPNRSLVGSQILFPSLAISVLVGSPVRIIALETSERIGSVALLNAEYDAQLVMQSETMNVVRATQLPDEPRSAQTLLPALHEMLTDCGWRADQLDLVCVTAGPGSFTGLRIGVTVAKALAYATGAKLVGVPTLSTLAASVPIGKSRLWAILDAQRQELFTACFDDSEPLTAKSDPKVTILSIEAWLSQLQAGDTVVGTPLKKLAERLPAGVEIADPSSWVAQAEMVGRLGIAVFLAGKLSDPMQLVPNYYRKSAAEEKADAGEFGS